MLVALLVYLMTLRVETLWILGLSIVFAAPSPGASCGRRPFIDVRVFAGTGAARDVRALAARRDGLLRVPLRIHAVARGRAAAERLGDRSRAALHVLVAS